MHIKLRKCIEFFFLFFTKVDVVVIKKKMILIVNLDKNKYKFVNFCVNVILLPWNYRTFVNPRIYYT